MQHSIKLFCFIAAAAILGSGCSTLPRAGKPEPRTGDEIVAAGQFFHTGTRVVLWMDPGGYDAYRVERRFSPIDKSDWDTSHAEVRSLTSPNRYGLRRAGLTTNEIERVRGGGWDLPTLQKIVDQFVLHFDVCGVSGTIERTSPGPRRRYCGTNRKIVLEICHGFSSHPRNWSQRSR